MTFSDLVIGGVYYVHCPKYGFKWIVERGENLFNRYGIDLTISNDPRLEKSMGSFVEDYEWEIREATKEEREWLWKSINADNIVPRESINPINNNYEIY
jgi:hypothetical protein